MFCPFLLQKFRRISTLSGYNQERDKKFGKTFEKLVGFLVIHGMLHLKGHEHSSTMDKLESKYDQKYFGRNRSRILDDEVVVGEFTKEKKS